MSRFYKIGFYSLLVLLAITIASYLFWIKNENDQQLQSYQSQVVSITSNKDELQKVYDDALARLDSITEFSNVMMTKLKIKKPADSLLRKLTDDQKRQLRLIDSINLLQDSINLVAKTNIQLLNNPSIAPDQKETLNASFNALGNASLTLDFEVDNASLDMLKSNTGVLKGLVDKFNKKVEKLDKFSKLLEKFTKYLQTAIDIFTAAVSQGFLVSKHTAVSPK